MGKEKLSRLLQIEVEKTPFDMRKFMSRKGTERQIDRQIVDSRQQIPLEDAIRLKLIPPLAHGRTLSDLERRLFALPGALGGMAVENPALEASHKHQASKNRTAPLTSLIVNQVAALQADTLQELKKAKTEEKKSTKTR